MIWCMHILPVQQYCHWWRCCLSGRAVVQERWLLWSLLLYFPLSGSTWGGPAPSQLVLRCRTVPPGSRGERLMTAHPATVWWKQQLWKVTSFQQCCGDLLSPFKQFFCSEDQWWFHSLRGGKNLSIPTWPLCTTLNMEEIGLKYT